MYYYFKESVFYFKENRDSLFMQNNFGSALVDGQSAYSIFKMILPYLNGLIDFDAEYISRIENKVIERSVTSLIDILKKNRFVLYSDDPININDYSKLERGILCCYGGLICKNLKKQFDSYILLSENEDVGNLMCDILYNSKIKIKLEHAENDYILIDGPLNLYIYKNQDDVIVSCACPKKEEADSDFFDLPNHIFGIIASFLGIELMLNSMDIHQSDFFKENYVFNLKLLSGSFVSIGERK